MREAQKGYTTMGTAEATTTENTATVAEQGAPVAPEIASSKKAASQKKGAPKGQKAAKGSKAKPAAKKEPQVGKRVAKPARSKGASTPRAESKGGKILELIGRAKGASLAEIMKATDWQSHSVREFLSTAAKSSELVRQEKFSEILRSPPTGFHLLPVAEAIPPRKGEFRFCRFSKCVCSS